MDNLPKDARELADKLRDGDQRVDYPFEFSLTLGEAAALIQSSFEAWGKGEARRCNNCRYGQASKYMCGHKPHSCSTADPHEHWEPIPPNASRQSASEPSGEVRALLGECLAWLEYDSWHIDSRSKVPLDALGLRTESMAKARALLASRPQPEEPQAEASGECETCAHNRHNLNPWCRIQGYCIKSYGTKERPKLSDKEDYYQPIRPAPTDQKALREALQLALSWIVSWQLPPAMMQPTERAEYSAMRKVVDSFLAHEAPKEQG